MKKMQRIGSLQTIVVTLFLTSQTFAGRVPTPESGFRLPDGSLFFRLPWKPGAKRLVEDELDTNKGFWGRRGTYFQLSDLSFHRGKSADSNKDVDEQMQALEFDMEFFATRSSEGKGIIRYDGRKFRLVCGKREAEYPALGNDELAAVGKELNTPSARFVRVEDQDSLVPLFLLRFSDKETFAIGEEPSPLWLWN